MSLQKTTPLVPLPFSSEKEQAVVNDILSDKPLYIRSKESEVHVGTKIIFEIRNEDDIEKLHPLVKSLGQSSSDLSLKNFITEVRQKQSLCGNSSVIADGNDSGRNDIKDSQKSQSTAGTRDTVGSKGVLVADTSTPSETMALPNRQEEDSFLLTPDFFQNDKLFESAKGDDQSSRYTSKRETTAQYDAFASFPSLHSRNKPLKLVNPTEPVQYSELYHQLLPMPYQHAATSQSCHSGSYLQAPNSPMTPTTVSSHFQHPLFQTSHSLPLGFSCSSPYMPDNLPRVKIHDRNSVRNTNNEHPIGYRVRLNKNYMEERNFRLYIFPGIFYDTHNGIIVEMKNGSNYEVELANGNIEDCDVDLYVDTEIVYKIRLSARSTTIIDGPENRREKFLFLRVSDAPPEANLINGHERNGQIKAVFKPKMKGNLLDERRRAWSADSAASCSRSLNQALGNIMGSSLQGVLASPPPITDQRYRSGSLCSGATALQGNQREKFFELAENIKVDENRMVVLQLRLVANTDDQSRPNTVEPIVPLITKMPPPLPF